MGMTTSELNNLIFAIEGGNYDDAKKALDATKEGNKKGSSIVSLRNNDYKTPLHVALEQPNPNLGIIQLLLDNGVDFNYCYSGPTDKKKQSILADNYLHIAARTGNVNAFLLICERHGIADITALNDNRNNPFHEAGKSGILFDVVKNVTSAIRSKTGNEIKKAKEAEDRRRVSKLQEELKNQEKYIKYALRSREFSCNEDNRTPLSYLNSEKQEEVKKLVGISDGLVCNRKLHIFLYVVGSIACISALCLSLYFLFIASETFALSSIVSIAAGGTTFLSIKACNELYRLYEFGTVSACEVEQVTRCNNERPLCT